MATRGPGGAPRATLAHHTLRWMAALSAAVTSVILVAMLVLVLLPLSQRSADDLAGLMLLSAQTWVELPPQTRADFEAELINTHHLAIQPHWPGDAGQPALHGIYIGFVERALAQRTGRSTHLVAQPGPAGEAWLWAQVPTGAQPLGVGFSRERMNTHPLWALGVVLVLGAGLAAGTAIWLARRLAQPVARLERAAAALASGTRPDLLPLTGPRELADLAGHFNQMASQLRELLDARTTLLAGVSHDLRTPLARMRVALELMRLQPSPALLDRLDQDTEVMNSLIAQLLELARGMGTQPRTAIDLPAWLAERADTQADAVREAHSSLTLQVPAGLQCRAAAGTLARVLDNLLGNALRYAPGAIELTATTFERESGPVVRISVLDRGPGIPAEQLGAVWRPFERVEASRSPQTGGYGLGLAIVRQLALGQGWRVGLDPLPGGGLQAWVELPLDAAPDAADG